MKRAFALSLLALAAGAASAQSTSSVTLYGIVDAGVQRVSGYKNGTDTALVSGIMEGSRFGLRGNEDIGGGWRALFTLENRTELNNGTLGSRPPSGLQFPDRLSQASLLGLPGTLQPALNVLAPQLATQALGVNLANAFWDRQAYVGVVTPVGAVVAGRQYTPGYEVIATFDTLETQSSLALGQVAFFPPAIDIRASNALQYRIQLGGLTASAMYAFGGVTGNSKANRLMGAMAMYRSGPFAVGVAHNRKNNELGQKALETTVIGGSVQVGPGTLGGVYALIKDDNPALGLSAIAPLLTPAVGATAAVLVQNAYINALRQDAKLMQIGYKLTTGPNTVYVAYNLYNDTRASNADTASYGVAYSYALSKRTDINAVATHFNNKGLGQAAPGQAGFAGGFTKSAGTDSNSFALGVRHRF
jgi:predicted porin